MDTNFRVEKLEQQFSALVKMVLALEEVVKTNNSKLDIIESEYNRIILKKIEKKNMIK